VKDQPDKPHELALDPENVEKVMSGMYGVVNEVGGTGVRAHLTGIDVCGKTGSAQLTSNDYAKTHSVKIKDNAWFVGLAPRHDPEIVVVTLFEGGEHGQLAAPISRDVIKAYFDKKARGGGPLESLSAAKTAPPALTPAAVPAPEIP
jgi:penicillin-binding protein 2